MSLTLSLYVARRLLGIVIGTFAGVFLLVVIVDLVELMRSGSDSAATFGDLLGMALLHAPELTITAAPFTVLVAAMLCFAILARSSELVVTRAAGVSVWRLLAPALLVAAGLGIFAATAYNPVASALAERFEALEERLFQRSSSRLSVSSDGLWLRQGGPEGQTVIHARKAENSIDRLWQVSVFQFGLDDRLHRRIDAESALLTGRNWRLTDVRDWDLASLTGADGDTAAMPARPVTRAELLLPTDLTPERIRESFAAPETISFWKLPAFIRQLEAAGFSSTRHRLHWYGLLSLPVVFCAMLLLGAAFSMRHARFGGLGFMALGGILTGFGYFFLSDLAAALAASGAIPVLVGAWAPPLSAVLLALGLLLHLEDG